jgi:hypothetical protein
MRDRRTTAATSGAFLPTRPTKVTIFQDIEMLMEMPRLGQGDADAIAAMRERIKSPG